MKIDFDKKISSEKKKSSDSNTNHYQKYCMSLRSNPSAEDKDLPNLTQVMHGLIAIVFLRVWSKAKKASGLQLMQNKQCH